MTTFKSYIRRGRGPLFLSPREDQVIQAAQNGIATEANLRAAISEAEPGDLLILAPGTITLTQQLVITKALRFQGCSQVGDRGTKITGAFAGALVAIDLAANANHELVFDSIYFKHGTDDTNLITLDNTNATTTLKVRFNNCVVEVYDSAADAFALVVSHTNITYPIQVKVTGLGWTKFGSVSWDANTASDSLEFYNTRCTADGKAAAVVSSADAIAAFVRFFRCEIPLTKGTSGGNAAQNVVSIHSYSLSGTTYAAAATTDFVGSHTETIV